MEQFTLQKVNAIPNSSWRRHKKGESIYNGLFDSLKNLPLNEPQKIQHPTFKANRIYNALWLMLKNRRVKNIRLAIRKNVVYAERMFE